MHAAIPTLLQEDDSEGVPSLSLLGGGTAAEAGLSPGCDSKLLRAQTSPSSVLDMLQSPPRGVGLPLVRALRPRLLTFLPLPHALF